VTPLWTVCEKGRTAVVELLLKAGADVDKEGADRYPRVRGLEHTAAFA
jgi:ankyrin repeat protein